MSRLKGYVKLSCLFVCLFVCLFAPLLLLPIKVWQVFSVEGFPLYHCQWQQIKLFALNVQGTSHKNFLSESVMVSFPSSLVGFLGFHPYMCLLSHHPHILCHFATAYTNMLCVFVTCVQRVIYLLDVTHSKLLLHRLSLSPIPLSSLCKGFGC